MVIWKYPLPIEIIHETNAVLDVTMPANAKVLSIQVQGGVPTFWALVDPKAAPELRRFVFHGTGTPIKAIRGEYVGTVQLYAGSLVLHCFEDPL